MRSAKKIESFKHLGPFKTDKTVSSSHTIDLISKRRPVVAIDKAKFDARWLKKLIDEDSEYLNAYLRATKGNCKLATLPELNVFLAGNEVIAGEFARLLNPNQPKVRLAFDDMGQVFVLSKKVPNDIPLSKIPAVNLQKSLTEGKLWGFGEALMTGIALQNTDLKWDNFVCNIATGQIFLTDSGLSFAHKVFPFAYKPKDLIFTPDIMREFPCTNSYRAYNFLSYIHKDESFQEKAGHEHLSSEMRTNPIILRERFRWMLKCILLPESLIRRFVNAYYSDVDLRLDYSNELLDVIKTVSLLAKEDNSFLAYLKTYQAREDAKVFFAQIQLFKTPKTDQQEKAKVLITRNEMAVMQHTLLALTQNHGLVVKLSVDSLPPDEREAVLESKYDDEPTETPRYVESANTSAKRLVPLSIQTRANYSSLDSIMNHHKFVSAFTPGRFHNFENEPMVEMPPCNDRHLWTGLGAMLGLTVGTGATAMTLATLQMATLISLDGPWPLAATLTFYSVLAASTIIGAGLGRSQCPADQPAHAIAEVRIPAEEQDEPTEEIQLADLGARVDIVIDDLNHHIATNARRQRDYRSPKAIDLDELDSKTVPLLQAGHSI